MPNSPALTPEQQENMKSWFIDLFILGGLPSAQKLIVERNYELTPGYKQAAKELMDAIKYSGDRSFIRSGSTKYFTETLDQALETLSGRRFLSIPQSKGPTELIAQPAEMLAKYIAWFCLQKEIYWNDTALSTFERDEIYNHSVLGKALADFYCFMSQDNPAAVVKSASSSVSKAGYKQKGPLSGLVPILAGKPGEKTTFKHPLYCLEADKLPSGNVPCIYIIPVSTAGTAVSTKEASSVKLGVANGYSYCELWWETVTEAEDFLKNCQNKFSGSKYTNLRVAKAKPASNGYFKVTTEFGNAYIKANKLNEDLLTTSEEIAEAKHNKYPTKSYIYDINVFTEAFLNSD